MDHPTSSERCRGVVCKRRLVRSEVADSSECNPAQKPPARKSRASAQQEVKAQLCWQGHVHFHTYHKDGVLICDDFLAGHCHLGQECQRHHTPRPYHWQLRQTHTKDWVNVSEFGQKHLEALFCNPDKTEVTLSFENAGGQGDLVQRQHRNVYHKSQTKGEMVCEDTGSVSGFSKLDLNTLIPQNNCSYNKVRRLATTSNPDLNPHFLTKWNISWQELGKWELYKEPVISQLEAAFEKGMWNQAFMLNGNLYNVDLKKYTQRNLTTNFIREVRRRPQLISDTELWPLINQKKFMSRGLPSAELSQLEMLLFHGTTKEAVPSICKNNFDPRVSGRQHGSTYGQGTYFAKNASCSARYAIESKSGSRYMFLAMVLVGKAAVGKQSFRRPPPLEPDSPTSDLYNSCVDKEQQPQMFVIFDSCQCYPYFLIHYKKLTDTVDVF
ncbi:protein mono-ADP-ribosyltransferase TIPARP-like isoform X3 [Polyodon spathula]|uniref:protein mono-ADP-ribosyltransferase TIPARP-like isoform X3 n=1 Tax=Polyodon spathula TaxID=7913 RepID=UPI001B7E9CE8|nr:protein mono-ADP-ribosyltransferase TIPARP-like isoform X3 [Polyodon spathula]